MSLHDSFTQQVPMFQPPVAESMTSRLTASHGWSVEVNPIKIFLLQVVYHHV